MDLFNRVIVTSLVIASGVFSTASIAKLPVSTQEVEQAPLSTTVKLHGTVYGKNSVALNVTTPGLLSYVIEPGQSVKQGDVVARIDMLPLELEKAKQQIMIERGEINLRLQKQELARLKQLAKTSSAAANQVDLVQNQHDLAEADIKLAKLNLAQIDDRISKASVKAPFNGVISERFVQAGSDVTRGQQLVHLIDSENLEIRAFVPIKYLNYVSLGQTMALEFGRFDSKQAGSATISAVIPASDPKSQTFEVRGTINDKGFASGQLLDVALQVGKAQPVLLVHRDALILRQQGVHVVKIDSNNQAKRIAVEVGKGQGNTVEIIPLDATALKAGDFVAIRGAERLADGQEVEVQNKL